MATLTQIKQHPFGETYANTVGALPGANERWIDSLRQSARAILGAQGLPSQKIESWKYTSLNDIAKTEFIPASRADDVDIPHLPMTSPLMSDALRVVFVNGVFRPDLSQSENSNSSDYELLPLSQTFAQSPAVLKTILGTVANPGESTITALNTSYMEDGFVILVEEGERLGPPIHIVSIGASGAQPGSFHPRFEIKMESGSQATVVETHIGLPGQPYLSNAVTEADVGEGARLNHYVVVNEDSDGFHLGRSDIHVQKAGRYDSFVLSMGGALVRREVRVHLNDSDASARVDGAYGISGTQHSDIHSEILHLAPNTVSNQTVKGVLGGQSRGIFQGRIHVARAAQGTDGRQLHKALLLNRGPEVDCKPELEIFADDVQCAHGATTGELDLEQLFYLMSRGIDEAKARALLIEGFLDDVVLNVEHEGAQLLIMEVIKNWLAAQTARIGGASQ